VDRRSNFVERRGVELNVANCAVQDEPIESARKTQVSLVARDDRVGLPERIGVITRPLVFRGMIHDSGSHGILFDIPVTSEQVPFAIDRHASESTFPECSCASVPAIEVRNIPCTEGLHGLGERTPPRSSQQQMKVIRH